VSYRRYLERGGTDRALCEEDYELLGGVSGSLRNRADEVFFGLPDDAHRATLARVMLRMVSTEGGELARKRVLKAEIVFASEDENLRVAQVLRTMDESRLVVSGKDEDDNPIFEPAHDELIRGWTRLLQWTRESSGSIQLRQVLSPAVRDWSRDLQPDTGKLWHANPRLALLTTELGLPHSWHKYVAKRIRDRVTVSESPRLTWLNRDESRFVVQSLARKHLITSVIAAVTVATLVVLGGLTVYAFLKGSQAVSSALVASANETKAKNALAESQSTLARSLGSGLGLAGDVPISVMEVESLWRLTTITKENENVRILFLKHALEDGITARQLRLRAASATLAAVQLDEKRRDRAIEEVVLPFITTAQNADLGRPSDKEARLTVGAIGVELGLLEQDSPESRIVAPFSLTSALNQLEGAVQVAPSHIVVLKKSAARLSSTDAVASIREIERLLGKTQPQLHLALLLTYAELVPRLGSGARRNELKHLCEVAAKAVEKDGHWLLERVRLMIGQGIDSDAASEATTPLIQQAVANVAPRSAVGGLCILYTLAPFWDDDFAARCAPEVRVYANAAVANALTDLGNSPSYRGCLEFSFLTTHSDYELSAIDLLRLAINLPPLYLRSVSYDVNDCGKVSEVILTIARRMTSDDRAALVSKIRETLQGKFESDKGRDELARLPEAIAALPSGPVKRDVDLSLDRRKDWNRAVEMSSPSITKLAAKPPQTYAGSTPQSLVSHYPVESLVDRDAALAATRLVESLSRPVPDNRFDMPDVLRGAATLQRIAAQLPETTRRQAASTVIRAILARVAKSNVPFPAADEAVVVTAALIGPGELTIVVKKLLASGTDLLGGYQTPGDKIMSQNIQGTVRFAEALLTREEVEIQARDLIEILKYPTCVDGIRDRILARLSRILKPSASYTSIWMLMDDLKARHPELHELAQTSPIRQR
jgi:hypothetical protein